jgi:nucleotide-binding universal stress UspA family protein
MYQNILVTLDGSELAEAALPHLEIVYKACQKPKVMLLRVVEPISFQNSEAIGVMTPEMIDEVESQQEEEANKYLNQVSQKLGNVGIPVSTEVASGKSADTIIEYVNKKNIDLLIMSTHGRSGISRWVLGSVADRIIRSVCIPVTIIRAPGCGLLHK